MNYSFHPHAEKELEEVEKYYDNMREELGDRFRAETEMAISQILNFGVFAARGCSAVSSL